MPFTIIKSIIHENIVPTIFWISYGNKLLDYTTSDLSRTKRSMGGWKLVISVPYTS